MNAASRLPLVELEQVNARYENEIVLENITTSIYPSELISIIGPNGSGKTTLLKIILGIIKPSAGRVRLFRHYNGYTPVHIGYVPQHILYDPAFPVTVLDVVLLGRVKSGFSRLQKKDTDTAMNVLDMMGMKHLAEKGFQDLSGGQRQRVLIARALAGEPVLLLMDEPTANIDRDAEKEIYTLIRELTRTMTVVLVSHDLGVVPKISTRVFCLNRNLKFHETTELTGDDIRSLYQETMDLVQHSHSHDEQDLPGKGWCGS
ncbi:MAG: metal ABC transporter ATP-binding protein [Spirochaetales bacterium]|nr:metal ABC transporter ATP-binding protein [Spirochaetales bacterium]